MIAIGLNLILGVLLFCALILGLRLERKLRGLRDSHTAFAKAVGELDQAAGRTENSLEVLRAGTETAKNEVASRIDQARIACQRLEKLVADADKAADRLAAQPLVLLDRAAPPPPRAPQAPQPPLPAPSAIARPEPDFRRPAPPARPAPEPAPSGRSRARMIDDDLFLDPIVGAAPPARMPEPRAPEPRAAQHRAPEHRPSVVNTMRTERPRVEQPANDRAAREALVREVLERDESALRDPFEQGRFAHERRAMMAAVMGGRR